VRPNETPDTNQPLHIVFLVYMGLWVGEIFDLEPLAQACAEEGRWSSCSLDAAAHLTRRRFAAHTARGLLSIAVSKSSPVARARSRAAGPLAARVRGLGPAGALWPAPAAEPVRFRRRFPLTRPGLECGNPPGAGFDDLGVAEFCVAGG